MGRICPTGNIWKVSLRMESSSEVKTRAIWRKWYASSQDRLEGPLTLRIFQWFPHQDHEAIKITIYTTRICGFRLCVVFGLRTVKKQMQESCVPSMFIPPYLSGRMKANHWAQFQTLLGQESAPEESNPKALLVLTYLSSTKLPHLESKSFSSI